MNATEVKRVQQQRVLIVDDNLDTAAFMSDLLAVEGYDAVFSDSGQGAIKMVADGGIDLVLLDVVMPDVNGITVASRIKSMTGPDDFLPVIMVTALAGEEDKITGLAYADDYITKPFSSEELLARTKSLLRLRRLHHELMQSTARYRSLYENSPHMYLTIDAHRVITECNLVLCRVLSVAKESILGRDFISLFRGDEHRVLDHFLLSLTSSGTSVQEHTFHLVHDSPEPITVALKAIYIGNIEPEPATVIAMEDVTQRERLEEEQRIARRQLYRSARLASIGTLASGVAHEMNNPLTAILGFSSALLDRLAHHAEMDRDELGQYLQIINTEALRCRDIVENLSKFAHEGELSVSQVLLEQCVADAVKLTHAKAARAHVTIDSHIDPGVSVRADAGKLEQVVVNVLSNCYDFCGGGSTVKIGAEAFGTSPRYIRLTIADNGPGIPSEILPKVFDPFFTTKEVGRGTGMGLAICHKIMEECDGSIDILSEPEGGTTVMIDIPYNDGGKSA